MRKCILALLLLLMGHFTSSAMGVEESIFTTVLEQGDFEIRDFPELVVAEVTVSGAQKAAANSGFRLHPGYIFGGNKLRHRFAMTAPVTQSPAKGTKISMTEPVHVGIPRSGGALTQCFSIYVTRC
jgi:hypothetical protein